MLKFTIRAYWRFWPTRWRRACLFHESCSRHVYAVAAQRGDVAAIGAFVKRFRRCRPGYRWSVEGGKITVIVADGTSVDESEIAAWLLALIQSMAKVALPAIESIDAVQAPSVSAHPLATSFIR